MKRRQGFDGGGSEASFKGEASRGLKGFKTLKRVAKGYTAEEEALEAVEGGFKGFEGGFKGLKGFEG